MKNIFSQKIVWTSLVFLVVLVIGTDVFLRWYGANNKTNQTPTSNSSNGVQVNDGSGQGDVSGNTVTHSDSGFDKKVLTIKDKVGLGCVVKVVNNGSIA